MGFEPTRAEHIGTKALTTRPPRHFLLKAIPKQVIIQCEEIFSYDLDER